PVLASPSLVKGPPKTLITGEKYLAEFRAERSTLGGPVDDPCLVDAASGLRAPGRGAGRPGRGQEGRGERHRGGARRPEVAHPRRLEGGGGPGRGPQGPPQAVPAARGRGRQGGRRAGHLLLR